MLKSGLGRITEGTAQYQGVVVYNMNDVPLGEFYLLKFIFTEKPRIWCSSKINDGLSKGGPNEHCRISPGKWQLKHFSSQRGKHEL